jgi:hypothetical protein
MCAFLLHCNAVTVVTQSRTSVARNDPAVNLSETRRKIGAGRFHVRCLALQLKVVRTGF